MYISPDFSQSICFLMRGGALHYVVTFQHMRSALAEEDNKREEDRGVERGVMTDPSEKKMCKPKKNPSSFSSAAEFDTEKRRV